jgi:hypothetical protein
MNAEKIRTKNNTIGEIEVDSSQGVLPCLAVPSMPLKLTERQGAIVSK